jgi:hypothetical protein
MSILHTSDGAPLDPRFPLGVPVNRRNPKDLTPVSGRPGWWKDRHGVERYIEPVKPAQPAT